MDTFYSFCRISSIAINGGGGGGGGEVRWGDLSIFTWENN